MINVLKLIEKANANYFSQDSYELGIDYNLFKDISKRCGYRVQEKNANNQRMFKIKKQGIPIVNLYSREENNKFNFLDISDLHVGNKLFDADKLHNILEKAIERNVSHVFIAGDIFESVYDPFNYDFRIMNDQKRHQIEKSFKNQLFTIFKILRQYNLVTIHSSKIKDTTIRGNKFTYSL